MVDWVVVNDLVEESGVEVLVGDADVRLLQEEAGLFLVCQQKLEGCGSVLWHELWMLEHAVGDTAATTLVADIAEPV